LAANGSTQPDFFALKMMSYIDAMFVGKRGKRIAMPVAIVLTKADYCPDCFDNPRGFAEANLNRLWNMCESRFAKVEFFATSVVGSLAYATAGGDDVVTPVPLHTALRCRSSGPSSRRSAPRWGRGIESSRPARA
jgi:hypothetical protein